MTAASGEVPVMMCCYVFVYKMWHSTTFSLGFLGTSRFFLGLELLYIDNLQVILHLHLCAVEWWSGGGAWWWWRSLVMVRVAVGRLCHRLKLYRESFICVASCAKCSICFMFIRDIVSVKDDL